MNQTTQTQISLKKDRFATKKKKKIRSAKSQKHRYTGGDLQNFCMTGPSSGDLYKTNPDIQGLG